MPRQSKPKANASELFMAIGERSRLKIIKLCLARPLSVDSLIDKTGLEKSLLSKHLKVLKECGILTASRSGRSFIYSLNKNVCGGKKGDTLRLHCCDIKLK